MTKAQSSNVLTQPIPRLAGIAKLCMQEKKICFKKLERREKNCKAAKSRLSSKFRSVTWRTCDATSTKPQQNRTYNNFFH